MNARIVMRFSFFLGALLAFSAAADAAPRLKTLDYPYTVTGKVVSVSDGGTVTLAAGARYYKTKLDGISAPRTREAYGQAAKTRLARLVLNKEVKITITGKDRYQWYVGEVFRNGTDVNAAMVRAGLARHTGTGDSRLAILEKEARAKHLGLWRRAQPPAVRPLRTRTKRLEPRPAAPELKKTLEPSSIN